LALGSPAFNDFNFREGPLGDMIDYQDIVLWVSQARKGDPFVMKPFASIMYSTLRPGLLRFISVYTQLPIVSTTTGSTPKCSGYCSIATRGHCSWSGHERVCSSDYSDAWVEREKLLEELVPEGNERLRWLELVRTVSEHPEDRAGAFWE
jgi:hypothetical protein